MNTGGWDTISVLDVEQVNLQLAKRLSELVMTFTTSWSDGFSGNYTSSGSFGAWSITGGSGSDVYLTLPIVSGTLAPQGGQGSTDISGMSVTVVVNLEWVPATVAPQGKNLQFALATVSAPGSTRAPGGIFVKSVVDPKKTGFGSEVGDGIAKTLLDNKDKITFIFAQTGVVDTSTATWLQPKQSTYSVHQPQGSAKQYLAILSVVDDRDISGLNANIDDGIVSEQYPLSFVISGNMFLEHVILPALPGAFPGTTTQSFRYANGTITAVAPFNLKAVQAGAIWYTPTVTAMALSINGVALKNCTSGSVYLDMPNAYLDFWATTNNTVQFNPSLASFSFVADPHPLTGTSNRVPWYDYVLTLGAVGAAVTAIVLAVLESSLAGSLAGSNLAGSLADAPKTSVKWDGLDQITIAAGSFDDAFLLLASVS